MSTVFTHVYRRGIEVADRHLSPKFANMEDLKLPTWGIVLLALTAFAWVVASALTQYTFSRLIPALVMVESPQGAIYLPLGENEPDASLDSKVDQELFLVKQTPITSSFRSTLRHLRSVGGFRSRFRGFRVFAVTHGATYFLSEWMSRGLNLPLGASQVVTAVLLANLSMTWTHVIMSTPSEKAWFRRIPSFQAWKKIAGPTAICAFAEQLAIQIPFYLAVWWDLLYLVKDDTRPMPKHDGDMLPLKTTVIILISLFLALMVAFPAKVAMTRVQASLLAEDQETIIPFDRSFDGKASEQDGVIGLVQAWKTFRRSSLIRLIKTYIKSFVIQVALAMFFFLVIAAEGIMILGPEKLMKLGRMATDPNVDEIRILPIDN